MAQPDRDRIAAAYRRFAEQEVRGRSALYEALARKLADDGETLTRLAGLPPSKRQPNLLLAAVRHVAGVPQDWPRFRDTMHARWDEIEATMLSHSTQTNEPGRCAVLLPVLARLPQPLALIEVGASAGLCLLPDRYAYNYAGHAVQTDDAPADTPAFPCAASPETPLPRTVPRIVWRAGLDLNPLDVNNAEQMTWLETLVWPEQTDRADRLKAAVRIARAAPPRIVRGDLRDGLQALIAEAPRDATRVVFHTAVLAYLPNETERQAFAASALSSCDYWISNEGPSVFPNIAARAPAPVASGRFILAANGVPLAWTDPHGAAMEWFGALPGPNPVARVPSVSWPGLAS